ncbi:hypothetical protein QBC39DRAFT_394531 [Podospora conica]|nr:hypothetical protein QBC39DRAFT_394531 [Schizothecium conicum]
MCRAWLRFRFPDSKLHNLKELRATSLESTVVVNSFFLDYFVAPRVPSYQPPFAMLLDVAHNTAAIPGSGDIPVVFTHTFNIARFVPALLAKPKWDETTYIIGDKLTWNEFLALTEEAKGEKFTVVYDSVETLKTGVVTELPSHPSMYAIFPKPMLQGMFAAFGVMFEDGAFDLSPASTLNEEFPDIKARTVKELVFEAWK